MPIINSIKAKWDKLSNKGKIVVGGAAVVVIYLIITNV
jgi:flagellar biosynthesis/type III secretory pathway M-ring protein FliF/YscJ